MASGLADRKWLWIGISAAVIAVAVASVLVFWVFKDDIFGPSGGPEATLEKMFGAMEDKDVDVLIAVLDPVGLEELETQGLSLDDFKDMRAQQMTYDSMEFSDLEMETQLSEDGQSATVTIVEGKLTVVADGETTVQHAGDNEESLTYDLVLRDGKWYLSVTAGS